MLIERKEKIGVIYLEKTLGIYKVENFAFCNKNDEAKIGVMDDLEYQYRLIKVNSFVDNKDFILTYVKDTGINSFKIENRLNEVQFQLPNNRKIIFTEIQQLHSIIKIDSEVEFVQWKNNGILQHRIKYSTNDFIYKSDNPLSVAVVGPVYLKTDDSIVINNIKLDEINDLNIEEYDALFINSRISEDGNCQESCRFFIIKILLNYFLTLILFFSNWVQINYFI